MVCDVMRIFISLNEMFATGSSMLANFRQNLIENTYFRFVFELFGIYIITLSLTLSYLFITQTQSADEIDYVNTRLHVYEPDPHNYETYSGHSNVVLPAENQFACRRLVSSDARAVNDIAIVNLEVRSIQEIAPSGIERGLLNDDGYEDSQNNRILPVALSGSGGNEFTQIPTDSQNSLAVVSSNSSPLTVTTAVNIDDSSTLTENMTLSQDNQRLDSELSENLNVLSTSSAHGPIECPPIKNFPVSMQAGAVAIQKAKGCPI